MAEVGARNGEIKGRRLASALRHLAAADRDLKRALDRVGPPPPRGARPGFAALIDIVVAQQISAAASDAIGRRLADAIGEPTPTGFLALDDGALRRIGFSRRKVIYARGIAGDIACGRLDLDRVSRLADEEAIGALERLKGIGRWSAEIYLLFALGRPDVLPADDLALIGAAARVKRLKQPPTPHELRRMGEPWRPWRSVAARLLWHYYRSA